MMERRSFIKCLAQKSAVIGVGWGILVTSRTDAHGRLEDFCENSKGDIDLALKQALLWSSAHRAKLHIPAGTYQLEPELLSRLKSKFQGHNLTDGKLRLNSSTSVDFSC